MVLYRVVSPPGDVLGDLGPPIPQRLVTKEKDPLLLVSPRCLLDPWVEVVVPSSSLC